MENNLGKLVAVLTLVLVCAPCRAAPEDPFSKPTLRIETGGRGQESFEIHGSSFLV